MGTPTPNAICVLWLKPEPEPALLPSLAWDDELGFGVVTAPLEDGDAGCDAPGFGVGTAPVAIGMLDDPKVAVVVVVGTLPPATSLHTN